MIICPQNKILLLILNRDQKFVALFNIVACMEDIVYLILHDYMFNSLNVKSFHILCTQSSMI